MEFTPRLLLLPFSWLFCFITRTRNFLYNRGVFKSKSYDLPIISVGNITVGGTGKTPLTELLIRTFSPEFRCALLSRGYGRKTKGPVLATESSTPLSIGDEPRQMQLKYPTLKVMVAEKRVLGISKLLKLTDPPQVILMDDAYQHRAVNPGFSILVVDYFRPMHKDFCLPAGNLREPLSGRKRANIMIVNKCPADLTKRESEIITRKLCPLAHQQIFFSCIDYQPPKKLFKTTEPDTSLSAGKFSKRPILAVAGIGNPVPFFKEARKYASQLETLSFRDHHDFTSGDIQKMAHTLKNMGSQTIVLTTEKDAVRLKDKDLPLELSGKTWYIPIELEILFNEQDTFIKTVEHYVKKN
ncbi:tetraacyldisaccharide 4'-kinase [Marinilabilia rubra]|uniref:Tetraacyldisaccharide 4'-kinase n=1 Tax=Marinilabilia rubra TaxID=2162893 RepID=A0A2U2BBG3_9BACT|nr:tetraacyldisaccharide 4'-kinase [Marinilabilia rubra]PWE00414.1 tetraacyldisaccharide 4'-kinase [Marinilabilia rubra]